MTTNEPKQPKSEEIENFNVDVKESKAFEYPEIDDGEHEAIVSKITLLANIQSSKGTFDMLKWYFNVDDKEIVGTSSAKVTTLSKAFGWIKSITGKEPEINKPFDFKTIKGMKCRIITKNEEESKEFNGTIIKMLKPVIIEVMHTKAKK